MTPDGFALDGSPCQHTGIPQHEEYALYLRDRQAWIELVAPRRAELLRQAQGEEKERLWQSWDEELQDAVRRLARRMK